MESLKNFISQNFSQNVTTFTLFGASLQKNFKMNVLKTLRTTEIQNFNRFYNGITEIKLDI